MAQINVAFNVDDESMKWLKDYEKRTGKDLSEIVSDAVCLHAESCELRFFGLYFDYDDDIDAFFRDRYSHINWEFIGFDYYADMYLVRTIDDEGQEQVSLFYYSKEQDLMILLTNTARRYKFGSSIEKLFYDWKESIQQYGDELDTEYLNSFSVGDRVNSVILGEGTVVTHVGSSFGVEFDSGVRTIINKENCNCVRKI